MPPPDDALRDLAAADGQAGLAEPLTLVTHQRACVQLGLDHRCYAFFCGTGTGKTPLALTLLDRLPKPALVVCPLSIIEPAWAEDAGRFFPDLSTRSLWAPTPAKRRKLLEVARPADVYLVNPGGFRILAKKHSDWLAAMSFRVAVVDESSTMKNPTARLTKALLQWAPTVPHRFAMSGTPAPNIEYEYWSQMRFVDPALLDASFFRFQRQFFYAQVVDPTNRRVVWRWGITDADKRALMQLIARRAVWYRKDDCLDLPPQVDEVRHVHMGGDQRRAYDAMLRDFVASLSGADLAAVAETAGATIDRSDVTMASNKLAQLMRLRQITAGFTATLDGERRWTWNGKVAEVVALLDEIGHDQVIIWTQFHAEMDALVAALARRGGDACVDELSGRVSPAHRPAIIAKFKRGDTQYLVAHPGCAKWGLTFTNCRYAIYSSLSYSLEEFWQSRDRIHRYGQGRSCTYFYILCPGIIDVTLHRVLLRKGSVVNAAIDLVREVA